jgi:hypothetical protein
MTTTFPRHFAFKHPVFRKNESPAGKKKKSPAGDWWEDSVYYFWWEFLRRHEGYKKTCENGGKGQYAKLYADFGNVHGVSFKEWWTKDGRGARLFSEPPLPRSVMALTAEDFQALPENWDTQSLLIVAIPLNLPKRYIEQRLAKILSQHHKRKQGQRTFKESRSLYPIAAQFSIESLKKCLALYELTHNEPQLKLWALAQRIGLGDPLNKSEIDAGRGRASPTAVAKKNSLGVAANKMLKKANNIIDGVGRGIFPAFSKTGKPG